MSWFKKYSEEDKQLIQKIQQMIGKKPTNLALYKLAISHASISQTILGTNQKESNERLEFLGDAVLGVVIAEYLFKKYPFKGEGFLTDIRSRIVNREALNSLAYKIGLLELIRYEKQKHKTAFYKSIGGDALEALIGAIYLDKGFKACKKAILTKLIIPHVDLDFVVHNTYNFKSKIIEWAQKENKELSFTTEEKGSRYYKEFVAHIMIGEEIVATGKGQNKKKAEQSAAEKACENLGI